MATNNRFGDRPLPVFRNLVNFTLFAPAVEEGGKQARLTVSFMDGRPRVSLFTNVSTDEKKGMASYGYYPEVFNSILDHWETALDMEPGMVLPIRNYGEIRDENNRKTGEKVVESQLNFGKDENGLVYIQLVAQGRTKIKFYFKLTDYNLIYKADKTPLTEQEASIFVARGWLKGIRAAALRHTTELQPEQADRSGLKPAGAGTKPAPAKSNADMLDFEDDIPL